MSNPTDQQIKASKAAQEQYEAETGKKWWTNPVAHGETAYASWEYQLWLENQVATPAAPEAKPILFRCPFCKHEEDGLDLLESCPSCHGSYSFAKPATPPAREAELQSLVHKLVVRIAEWDGFAANSIKGNVIGGIILDVLQKEDFAHAAKAVADCKRGLVDFLKLYPEYRVLDVLDKVRAWINPTV